MDNTYLKELDLLENSQLPPNWEWVACSPYAKVAYEKGSRKSFFKEFIPRNRMENIKAFIRGSRCERWIKQAEIAQNRGFEVPTILASGKLKNGHDYLITAPGPEGEVPDFLLRHENIEEADRIHWIKSFACYTGLMHKAGIVHGDMRPGNILMEPTPEGRFVMIDIERNSLHKKVPMALIKKNLVQLAKKLTFKEFTAKDRIVFFRAYNQAYGRFSKKQQKELAYEVIRLVKKQGYWGGNKNVSSISETLS